MMRSAEKRLAGAPDSSWKAVGPLPPEGHFVHGISGLSLDDEAHKYNGVFSVTSREKNEVVHGGLAKKSRLNTTKELKLLIRDMTTPNNWYLTQYFQQLRVQKPQAWRTEVTCFPLEVPYVETPYAVWRSLYMNSNHNLGLVLYHSCSALAAARGSQLC